MTDQTDTTGDRAAATPRERSMNASPKVFTKATLAAIGVAVLLMIIGIVMITSFFGNPSGGAEANSGGAAQTTR